MLTCDDCEPDQKQEITEAVLPKPPFEANGVSEYNKVVVKEVMRSCNWSINVYDMGSRYIMFQKVSSVDLQPELSLWVFKALLELSMFNVYDTRINGTSNVPRLLLTELSSAHPEIELSLHNAMTLTNSFIHAKIMDGLCNLEDDLAAVLHWGTSSGSRLLMSKVFKR